MHAKGHLRYTRKVKPTSHGEAAVRRRARGNNCFLEQTANYKLVTPRLDEGRKEVFLVNEGRMDGRKEMFYFHDALKTHFVLRLYGRKEVFCLTKEGRMEGNVLFSRHAQNILFYGYMEGRK